MADLTVSSAVDTFMAAANQAAMLSALNITLGGAFTTSGSFTTTLTVTGNTNVTLPTSGTLAILGANIFTNVQTLPSGTAGAPSLNFGDTTSGLYRSAADRVAIATAGAIRMEIGIIAGVGTCLLYTSSGNSAYLGTGGSNTAMLGNSSNNSSLCGFWNVSAATGRLSSTNRAYPLAFGGDVILLGKAAAVLQLGSDAAGVINQMLTAASRITSDGVGANLTLSGGNGRGGAGGSLILATYDTQGAGTIGNLVTRLTIDTAGLTTFTSAANTGVISATGYSLTGSNATSMIDLAGTWNTSGTPTALLLNITNTASNAASKLIDLQVGGVSRFNITREGQFAFNFTNASGILGTMASIYGTITFQTDGLSSLFVNKSLGTSIGDLIVASNAGGLKFGSSNDLILGRKAAAVLRIGEDAAGVTNQMITAASRITSDGVGATLTIAGGNGRGGAGGSLIFSYYTTAAAATIGTLTEAMRINTLGQIVLNNLPTSDPGVVGALYRTAGAVMISV